jgi:hypothetical protein
MEGSWLSDAGPGAGREMGSDSQADRDGER